MSKFNENLYSRQIITYGKNIMKKILNLKILIIGLRGLGIEISKNMILSGPKELYISDKNKCKINDLGTNFYIIEDDVDNITRENACFEKLSLLNPYVKISIYEGNLKEDLNLNKFNLIIITEIMNVENLYEINDICRQNNICFIYTLNFGLTGYLFNDFGENHIIKDVNGEKNLIYQIFNIEEKEDNYEIFLDIKNEETLDLKEGDYIIFKDVKGLEFLNDGVEKKILKITKNSFEIKKIKKNNLKYIEGGIVEEFKQEKILNFNSFKNNLFTPNNNYIIIDQNKKYFNILLHCSFVGLHKFYNIKNKLPELNNFEEINEIIELCYNYYLEIKKNNLDYLIIKKKNKIIEFNKEYITNVLRWSKSEINPITSFLGGIVSQEAIKITGKYMPIYQWLRFDFFEIIKNIPNNCNRNLLNCRYDDQIAIFGQEIQEKLKNLNIFMIGAGALGCEYLKNFALMGIGTNNNNIITVTDNDNIVISNLNRQFLFKNNDIGKSKSLTVCKEVKKINKDINLNSYQFLVSEKTKYIFDDLFWEKQNIIISAVDNIETRRYIDNQCTFYNKIFIDSGTEGTKANHDIYIPNKTICLNDLEYITKKKIPMCTLKNFPTEIEHCIEYAKIIFSELFHLYIEEIKLTIKDENKFYKILNDIKNNDELFIKLEILKYLYNIIDNPSTNLIIKFSIFIFNYYFIYNINKLLNEQKDEFINNYKKKPSPIDIDLEDETNILFFKSFYHILSNILNIELNINKEQIKSTINNDNINIIINKVNKEEIINNFTIEIINKIKNNINNIRDKITLLNPVVFEKDNDDNYQINFILSFSNLRAKNYNLNKCDFLKAKEIAGNIIPAICSTTAAITGLSCLQIYTLLQTDDIKFFRCGAFNLATSEFDLFKPEEVRYIKDIPKTKTTPSYRVIPKEFNVWDKIDLNGPNMNVKNIIDFFKKYDVDIDFINYSNLLLDSPFESDENFNKSIEELITEKTGKKIDDKMKYIKLDLSGSIKDSEIITPNIRYILNNK